MAGILQEIEAALSPIIGPGGVVALYKRSLHLAGASHPWLVDSLKQSAVGLDLASLETAFAAQSAASAAVAGAALLQTFHQLLVSLIGPSLTERLLRGVWENSSNGPFAQDTSP
ncbi:MAG: hypothetical protein ABWY06_10445 [Pseudomonas sp.]|uniref:hypothetical protein n=1 Tax=Pseudomonas sp. TaxID=306 RepID=UPI0033969607